MLVIGFETLNWSADIQMKYENEKDGKKPGAFTKVTDTFLLAGSMVLAVALAVGLFFTLPIYIATLLRLTRGALLFNCVAGIVRLVLFLLYLYIVSRMPDIKRVFRYHGAEHKSIMTLEAAGELDLDTVRGKSRFHPRCGTSFILIVAIISIVFFGIADSLFPIVFGHMQSLVERLITHLSLLPLVAGGSYELLKLSGKFRSKSIVKLLISPGLWLQKLTTAEPDDAMLEVALCALKAVLGREEGA